MNAEITPFRIAAADSKLDDLKRRLGGTQWLERERVDAWAQVPLAYAQELCRYLLNKYDWRQREARLNRFTQFKTTIDSLDDTFSSRPFASFERLAVGHESRPVGSIVEFHKVIEPLTNRVTTRRFSRECFFEAVQRYCWSVISFGM